MGSHDQQEADERWFRGVDEPEPEPVDEIREELDAIEALAAEAWRVGHAEGFAHDHDFHRWWKEAGESRAAALLTRTQDVQGDEPHALVPVSLLHDADSAISWCRHRHPQGTHGANDARAIRERLYELDRVYGALRRITAASPVHTEREDSERDR